VIGADATARLTLDGTGYLVTIRLESALTFGGQLP